MDITKTKLSRKLVKKSFTTDILDIILLDIVAYSQEKIVDQNKALICLYESFKQMRGLLQSNSSEDIILKTISTGDGFYIILNRDSTGFAPLFALSFRNKILAENKLCEEFIQGIRIATHTGMVGSIDLDGTPNYCGHGLNDCARFFTEKTNGGAEIFYQHSNYIIVSDESWKYFNNRYSPRETEIIKSSGFKHSNKFIVKDKHCKNHSGKFIDCNQCNYFPYDMKSLGEFT